MQVITLPVGDLMTNCYLLCADNGDAALIDPGAEPQRILHCVRETGVTPQAIWLTHGHFDHIGGVEALVTAFGCPVIACRAERALLLDPSANLSSVYGSPCTVQPDRDYADGERFSFGGMQVALLHSPGHTAGSCCYLVERFLFSGDTLFDRSVGRTDLPTGSPAALQRSLARLAALPADYTVLPGHGAATTLEIQRQQNPYMQKGVL